MNDSPIPYLVAAILAIFAICGTFLYGCSQANKSYNDLANNCVKAGGSWIHKSEYSGLCINANKPENK